MNAKLQFLCPALQYVTTKMTYPVVNFVHSCQLLCVAMQFCEFYLLHFFLFLRMHAECFYARARYSYFSCCFLPTLTLGWKYFYIILRLHNLEHAFRYNKTDVTRNWNIKLSFTASVWSNIAYVLYLFNLFTLITILFISNINFIEKKKHCDLISWL